MSKYDLLRRMARRMTVNVSEKLPLTITDDDGEEVDISDGGTYFVQFKDVGGAAKDVIFNAGLVETVETATTQKGKGQFTSKETVRRERRLRPAIEAIVEQGMVVDACFPVENAGNTFQGWRWKEDNDANLEFLFDDRLSLQFLMWFVSQAYSFLAGPEEVMKELGESSGSTAPESQEPTTQ